MNTSVFFTKFACLLFLGFAINTTSFAILNSLPMDNTPAAPQTPQNSIDFERDDAKVNFMNSFFYSNYNGVLPEISSSMLNSNIFNYKIQKLELDQDRIALYDMAVFLQKELTRQKNYKIEKDLNTTASVTMIDISGVTHTFSACALKFEGLTSNIKRVILTCDGNEEQQNTFFGSNHLPLAFNWYTNDQSNSVTLNINTNSAADSEKYKTLISVMNLLVQKKISLDRKLDHTIKFILNAKGDMAKINDYLNKPEGSLILWNGTIP